MHLIFLVKSGVTVGDDPVGYTEAVDDVFHELCCLLRRDGGHGSDFNPFGELIHCHQDVPVTTKGRYEGSL
jgi:hypothetical protein